MNNADLRGRRKVRSGLQTIFNSVAQPQPAARERMMMVVPMMSSRSVHEKYVKCGSLVRSSAGGWGVVHIPACRVFSTGATPPPQWDGWR
jgi:hypothetical protein